MTRKRFIHCGGDVIDQSVPTAPALDLEDAADLITEWRAKAQLYRQSRLPGLNALRLARWCETDADELEEALNAAIRWKRCGDFYPLANVGRSALEQCIAAINGEKGI